MTRSPQRVLIACYGGGHVQSLIPVARAIGSDSRYALTVLGFTSARAAFERAGIAAIGYPVLEHYLLQPCAGLIAPFIETVGHPDISAAETRAYFHVGLHDLIEIHGQQQALKLVAERGRAAFHPVRTFRRFLEDLRPDLVMTSTSPRSELSLQVAARSLAIPGLAVSDLFLQHEASYLCAADYAPHITVLAEHVKNFLLDAGCTATIHATGNPAFDGLFKDTAQTAGAALRADLGLDQSIRLLTWIGSPSEFSLRGKPFVQTETIVARLEAFCGANSSYRFAFRPHPNRPVRLPDNCRHGVLLDSRHAIEAVLWASDAVLVETSTVGLQAALIGRPVITLAAGDYPPYAALGLATDIPHLDMLDAAITKLTPPRLDLLAPVGLGDATERVVQVVQDVLNQRTIARSPA